jgi:hypothetical protein
MRIRTGAWHLRSLIALGGAALLVACVDKGPGAQGKTIDPAYIEAHLLSAPPTDLTNAVNADLGGKIVYLGNVAPPGPVAPGQKITIKHYWKVVVPPGKDWRVFSHLRGDGNDFQNVDQTDMRTGHGPATWQAGEIIEDVQDFALKSEWKSKTATLIVGLYPRGKHKVEDRMAVVSGPSLDGAVVAVKLDVDVSKAPPPAGAVVVRKASAPVTIDGRADEAAWAGAATSADFATADGSPEPPGKTTAKLTWDDQALYVFAQVGDPDVWSEYKNTDDPLWKADVVELFIDADGNRRGYVELQVNPNNTHFDSWFAGSRTQPGDPTWSSGMTSAVVVRGTADNRDDRDAGWDVEIAIPWAAVKGKDDGMAVAIPPRPGDSWKLNVVRVDKVRDAQNPSASSWSKISYQDFHGLDRLLTVVFADAAGGTSAPPPGAEPAGEAASSTTPPAEAAGKPGATPATKPGAKPAPTTEVTPGSPAAARSQQPPATKAPAGKKPPTEEAPLRREGTTSPGPAAPLPEK